MRLVRVKGNFHCVATTNRTEQTKESKTLEDVEYQKISFDTGNDRHVTGIALHCIRNTSKNVSIPWEGNSNNLRINVTFSNSSKRIVQSQIILPLDLRNKQHALVVYVN